MSHDSKPDRVTRRLARLGIVAKPAKTYTVKTEAKYVADWTALFGRAPSAAAVAKARAAGQIS